MKEKAMKCNTVRDRLRRLAQSYADCSEGRSRMGALDPDYSPEIERRYLAAKLALWAEIDRVVALLPEQAELKEPCDDHTP
jgi:hypothetical protein